MSVFERKAIGSFTKLLPFVAAAVLMTPTASKAELLLLLREAADSRPVPEITLKTVKRAVDICLDENGDLVMKRGNVSLTMAYRPPDEFIEPQERIRIVQRQDCPAISGISLKVSLLF